MFVAHVINNLPVGGAERFLLQLAATQRRHGLRVALVALVEPNPLAAQAGDIPFTSLGRTRLNDPRLMLDLVRWMRAHRPDVVHTHLFYADTFGRVAARAAGIRAILSTEHSTTQEAIRRRRLLGMRWTSHLAHRIVAVSEPVRDACAARLGLDPTRIPVIPNGIDLASFEHVTPLPRDTLGLPADAVIAGGIGRLIASKGWDDLLYAVAQLADPRLHVVLAGDGPHRPALERLAADLGLQAQVHLLGFRDDVERILAMLDVFVLPSHFEGHSVALLEAMACGRACVVSDIPEIAGTVGDAAAIRVPPGAPDALAGALAPLVADPARRHALGAAARERAADFSIEHTAQQYEAQYTELLQAAGAKPAASPGGPA